MRSMPSTMRMPKIMSISTSVRPLMRQRRYESVDFYRGLGQRAGLGRAGIDLGVHAAHQELALADAAGDVFLVRASEPDHAPSTPIAPNWRMMPMTRPAYLCSSSELLETHADIELAEHAGAAPLLDLQRELLGNANSDAMPA